MMKHSHSKRRGRMAILALLLLLFLSQPTVSAAGGSFTKDTFVNPQYYGLWDWKNSTKTDLHIEYNFPIKAPDPKDITPSASAEVTSASASDGVLDIKGSFPPSSSVTVTVSSDSPGLKVKNYYWTIAGIQIGKTILLVYDATTAMEDGTFEHSTFVHKPPPPEGVVDVTRTGAINIANGMPGVTIGIGPGPEGLGTNVTFMGKLDKVTEEGQVTALIDPPDEIIDYVLIISPPSPVGEQYYLTVGGSAGGTVTVVPPGSYAPGIVVTLKANPDPGYAFLNWTGDVATVADVNSASTTITMDDDYTVTPNFTPIPVPFDFSLLVAPLSVSVVQGGTATYSVPVTLVSGLTQPVTLSASGVPPAATPSLAPSSGGPTYGSSLIIATSAATPAGTYTITITGTGGGVSRFASLILIVTAAVTKEDAERVINQAEKEGRTVGLDKAKMAYELEAYEKAIALANAATKPAKPLWLPLLLVALAAGLVSGYLYWRRRKVKSAK